MTTIKINWTQSYEHEIELEDLSEDLQRQIKKSIDEFGTFENKSFELFDNIRQEVQDTELDFIGTDDWEISLN